MQDFASFLGRLGYRDDFNSCPSHHLDELHLVELVLPEEAARVAPARARLRAEARRGGHVRDGQLCLIQDLVRVQVGEGHLRGRDEEAAAAVERRLPRGVTSGGMVSGAMASAGLVHGPR